MPALPAAPSPAPPGPLTGTVPTRAYVFWASRCCGGAAAYAEERRR